MITRMLNISLKHGYFADEWKKALVHPLLKNSGLQLINKNFRPVSNLQSLPNLQRRRSLYNIRSTCESMVCFQNCKVLTTKVIALRPHYLR